MPLPCTARSPSAPFAASSTSRYSCHHGLGRDRGTAAAIAAAKLSAAPRLTAIMISTVLVLLVAHALEVLVWALTYRLVDLVPAATASISPSSTTRRWAMATSCPRPSGACSALSLR